MNWTKGALGKASVREEETCHAFQTALGESDARVAPGGFQAAGTLGRKERGGHVVVANGCGCHKLFGAWDTARVNI